MYVNKHVYSTGPPFSFGEEGLPMAPATAAAPPHEFHGWLGPRCVRYVYFFFLFFGLHHLFDWFVSLFHFDSSIFKIYFHVFMPSMHASSQAYFVPVPQSNCFRSWWQRDFTAIWCVAVEHSSQSLSLNHCRWIISRRWCRFSKHPPLRCVVKTSLKLRVTFWFRSWPIK